MRSEPKRKNGRSSLSPGEVEAKQFRAKCRFKALVRFVIANLYWLYGLENGELGDSVQRNVNLLTRKRDKKSLLGLTEKSILNKPAHERTEGERNHLYRVIGGLKCFRRYPNHVKMQLAAATYYVYYGPGRILIEQGDFARAMYFVVTGDVAISQKVFDPVVNQMVKIPLGEMGPGSIFGEVSLLHDIPRTATVTTINHCELLSLRRDDFKVVLKATVQEQWNEVLASMKMFTYFDEWDEISKRECCILSKTFTFEPDQTILGDECGLSDHVYFVLSGKCRLVENLYVVTEKICGRNYYRLQKPLDDDFTSRFSKREVDTNDGNKRQKRAVSIVVEDPKPTTINLNPRADSLRKSLISLKEESKSGLRERSKSMITGESSNESANNYNELSRVSSESVSIVSELSLAVEKQSRTASGVSCRYKSRVAIGSSKIINMKAAEDYREHDSVRLSSYNNMLLCPNLKPQVHFMQLCLFNATACFSIGENMKNRRIVAIRETKCLLIPRYWLMQKKHENIWTRVQQFLNRNVPTTQQVFKEFVIHKRWLNNRKRLMKDMYEKARVRNDNVCSNVPYTLRIIGQVEFP